MHGRSDFVEKRDDRRIQEVIEGIAKRRREHDRAGRARLVMVVDDLRKPAAEEHLVDDIRLRKGTHVEVAIVIVSGIFVVKPRKSTERAMRWIALLHIPVGYQFHTVRIDEAIQND